MPIVAETISRSFTTGNSPSEGDIIVWDSTTGQMIWQPLDQISVRGAAVVNETPSGAMDGTNVTFTLAYEPLAGTQMLFYNGMLQKPGIGNDYTITGQTITMADPPGKCVTDLLLVWYLREGDSPISPDGFTYLIKTTTYSATAWDAIFCDTTAVGAWELTMPVNPTLGDTVRIINMTDSFALENLTIGRNGENIMGLAENLTIDINRSFDLKFSNTTEGWCIY